MSGEPLREGGDRPWLLGLSPAVCVLCLSLQNKQTLRKNAAARATPLEILLDPVCYLGTRDQLPRGILAHGAGEGLLA